MRRMIRTVEFFQSAPDKLRSGVGLTDIAKRIEDYYDTYAERLGVVNAIIREANKKISFGRKREALDTFEEFIRARENGRTDEAAAILNNASESDRQLIDAWNQIAEETGRVNLSVRTPNGQPMKVYDPNLVTGTYGEGVGGFRPIRAVKQFFPRTLRREVLEVMMNSDKDPALYNELLDALIASGRVETREEADNYLTKEWFSDEIKQDYFAGVEKARTDPLPEVFYDYSWDAATRYLRKWARRTSQIQYFGQEMGQFQKDWFDTNIPKVRDDETQEYLNEIKNRVYEIESFDFISNIGNWLNSLATATQLGNPVRFGLTSLNTNNGQQICGRGPTPFPNGADYSLWLLPTYVRQEDGHMRGILPGMLWMPQDRPYSDQTILDNVVGQAGKRFLLVRTQYSSETEGAQIAFDITGPWR